MCTARSQSCDSFVNVSVKCWISTLDLDYNKTLIGTLYDVHTILLYNQNN